MNLRIFRHFADEYVGFFGEAAMGNIAYAEANNIIDGTKSFPEFRQYMIEEFGLDEELIQKLIKLFHTMNILSNLIKIRLIATIKSL